jgi:hypothetical protein
MGFFIKKLSVQGKDLKSAVLPFSEGANFVVGASDTGKSFVFSALGYLLGKDKLPKDIVESIGYTDFYLEIQAYQDAKTYTILRKKGSKNVEVKECSIEVFLTSSADRKIYKTNVKLTDELSYSNFLLGLSGLQGKKLLFSKTTGKTQGLSFKNLMELTFIAEDRIITEGSPFYFTSQVINKTLEQSLLNLLLTGDDFSNIQPKENLEQKEHQINGKLEFIANQVSVFVSERENAIRDFSNNTDLAKPQEINALQMQMKSNIDEAKSITNEKNEAITRIQSLNEEKVYNENLLYRFDILNRQYKSDQKRLEFLLEGESLSSQLGSPICPICLSELDENNLYHLNEIADFRESASEELKKIELKLGDLSETIKQLRDDNEKVAMGIRKYELQIRELDKKLTENFNPQINQVSSDLRGMMEYQNQRNKIDFIDEQLKKLQIEQSRLTSILENREKEESVTIIQYSTLLDFCGFIKSRLTRWGYEPFVEVMFDRSYEVFDIIISGKSRRSYGKGKRAISYSACLLALLDYCLNKNTNFSNIIVLDSPLTTYKGKDIASQNEDISSDIESLFFDDLVSTNYSSQVIIFDNKIPEVNIQMKSNTIIFTGDASNGRFGFFPMN